MPIILTGDIEYNGVTATNALVEIEQALVGIKSKKITLYVVVYANQQMYDQSRPVHRFNYNVNFDQGAEDFETSINTQLASELGLQLA